MNSVLAAALDYARRGWPVFPCSPETKAPLLPKETAAGARDGGLYLASTDAGQIAAWWQRWPKAMIGMPMGRPLGHTLQAASGAVVIDLDPKTHSVEAMRAGLEAWLGQALEGVPRVRTRSGGWHFWFAMPDGVEIGNRGGLFRRIADVPEAIAGATVDVRASGGYVIVPPSVMSEGTYYAWEVEPDGDLPPLPERLRDAILKRLDSHPKTAAASGDSAPPPGEKRQTIHTGDDPVARARHRYAMAALEREVTDLAAVGEGARGHECNKVAYSLGGLVGAGILSETLARAEIYAACERNGLTAKDGAETVRGNIERSLAAGAARPIDLTQIGARAGTSRGTRLGGAQAPPPPDIPPAGLAPPAPSDDDASPPPPTSEAGAAGEDDADDPGDPGETPPPDDDLDWDLLRRCTAEPPSDLGNSRRLRHRHGHELIHIQNIDFYAYDGRRWQEDIDGRVSRPICHATVDMIGLEPMVMGPTPDEQAAIEAATTARDDLRVAEATLAGMAPDAPADDRRAARLEIERLREVIGLGAHAMKQVRARRATRRKFAVSSGNSGKITGMLGEAMAYLSHPVTDLDTEALAFNCGNGTLRFLAREVVDLECPDPDVMRLKTEWAAELFPHRREDMISKLADVDYDLKAEAPQFLAFLAQVLPKPAVRSFLQRYFGYAMTAYTREQVFVILHGEGRNGKSTLVDIIARILADYSTSLPIATLVNDNRSGKGSEATPDLAKLPGARFVRTAEPKEGMSFDESLIKQLTSDEPLPVRRLNKDFIDFYPDFKLVISCNRKPIIRGNDDGIWRRVLMVPFEVQIAESEIDKTLSDKLWAERSGILNWLIEGCLDYLREGLRPPEEVRAATKEYREESDMVGGFVRAALIVTGASHDQVEAGALYAAFVVWCQRGAQTPVSSNTFNRRMPKAAAQFGFTKVKSSVSIYAGITVRSEYQPRRRDGHGGDDDMGGWGG